MVLVMVTFTTQFCSMIIDGRMPIFETSRQGLYMLPEDQAHLFCKKAIEMENVNKAIIYRHYKTYK